MSEAYIPAGLMPVKIVTWYDTSIAGSVLMTKESVFAQFFQI